MPVTPSRKRAEFDGPAGCKLRRERRTSRIRCLPSRRQPGPDREERVGVGSPSQGSLGSRMPRLLARLGSSACTLIRPGSPTEDAVGCTQRRSSKPSRSTSLEGSGLKTRGRRTREGIKAGMGTHSVPSPEDGDGVKADPLLAQITPPEEGLRHRGAIARGPLREGGAPGGIRVISNEKARAATIMVISGSLGVPPAMGGIIRVAPKISPVAEFAARREANIRTEIGAEKRRRARREIRLTPLQEGDRLFGGWQRALEATRMEDEGIKQYHCGRVGALCLIA